MKVLMLNGSSHINGTTMAALTEVGKALEEDGIEYEISRLAEARSRIALAVDSAQRTDVSSPMMR